MRWLWLGGAVLLAVAAAATWFSFSNPTFFVGLATASVGALVKAVGPWVRKLLTSKGSAEARQRAREGRETNERESR